MRRREVILASAGFGLCSWSYAQPASVQVQEPDLQALQRQRMQEFIDVTRAPDVTAVLRNAGRYQVFLALLALTGLDKWLEQAPVFTVFAPMDTAWDGRPDPTKLDAASAKRLAQNHLSASPWRAPDDADKPLNLNQRPMDLNRNESRIGSANFVAEGIRVRNGTLNLISGVIDD